MFKKLLSVVLLFCISISAYSQKTHTVGSSKGNNDKVIVTIDTTKITYKELKKAFEKNSMKQETTFDNLTKDSALSFVNLYTNYRLKVIDGISKGMDKDSAVIADVKSNRKLLAESFWLDKAITEPAVQSYTNLRKYDKKIAIIMTNFSPLGDTLEAYSNIEAAITELQKGAPFDYVARKYSNDTSTARQGGVLPIYITGLKVQKVLETAIMGLKIGEYTAPIKNEYGYFVIKLLDEQPRQFIAISHILIPYENHNAEDGIIIADSAAAKKNIDSLYRQLKNGADFGKLAATYSYDRLSGVHNGFIGIYSRSTGLKTSGESIVTEVETVAYSLSDKQFSEPVMSKYGYHLVRRDSTVIYPADFERDEIKATYRRLYYQTDYDKFIDSLAKNVYGYKLNIINYNTLLSYYDPQKTALDSNFTSRIPQDDKNKTLYSILNKDYSIGSFIGNITTKPDLRITATSNEGFKKAIHKLYEPVVLEEGTRNIEQQYPQFNEILTEFRDGILLFKMEAINVWDKMKFDTALAKRFYDTTTMNLTRPAHYDISEIFMLSDTNLEAVLTEIRSGKITFDSAATEYTQRNNYRDKQGKYGVVTAEKNKLAAKADSLKLKVGDISDVLKHENGYTIIKINGYEPARRRTFEEALPEISPKVQTMHQAKLEADWLSILKKQHKIVIDQKAMNVIFKKK